MFDENNQNHAPFMTGQSNFDDFSNTEVMPSGAVFAMEKAANESQVAIAKRFPRNIARVQDQMKTYVSMDTETAANCFYKLPRGGKSIEGPSVRLAEIVLSSYQNAKVATRILDTVTSGPNPHVVIQAVACDLENNIQVGIEKRRRITKKKNKEFIDDDDIQLAVNSCSAIAFRDAVFKMVPKTLYEPVYKHAKLVAVGTQKTLPDRVSKAMDAFQKLGITKEKVLGKFGYKKESEINLDDLETLIGIFSAIKDGELNIDEAFRPDDQPKEPKSKSESKKQSAEAKQTPQKEEETEDAMPDESPSLISDFYTMVGECKFGVDVMESDVLAFIKKAKMDEGDYSTLEDVPETVLQQMIDDPVGFKSAWKSLMIK